MINTAASAYYWENVYKYDITFRHFMAFNPSSSWAITYNQMWNLSMQNPLPKGNKSVTHFNGNHTSFNKSGGNGPGNGKAGGGRKIKSPYCWNFNKGVKCKFGNKCKFIERCSYCDAPNHGVHVCPKLQKKEGGGANDNGPVVQAGPQ